MDAVGVASNAILYGIVIIAVVQDFYSMRISNRLIGIGLASGLGFRIILEGPIAIVYFLVNTATPVIMLYLLFLIGAIGAGDIKLFSVIGSFVNFKQLILCIGVSFLFGAAVSIFRMIQNRNLQRSVFHALGYFRELMQGNYFSYRETNYERHNVIHFSLAICLSILAVKGVM